MWIGIRQGGAPTHTARIKHCSPCSPSLLLSSLLPPLLFPLFENPAVTSAILDVEVLGDSRLYVLTLVAGQGACLCLGLLFVCCCRRHWGAWSRLRPGVASAVLLVLVRANLGSKGESLGLLAQAAFAIGFLDTSWDFNRCEVQTEN